jgi:hypothetical protein
MELDHPLPLYQPAADISLERAECRVVPGETARFPFVLRTWPDGQSIHDLDVVSANPNFNRSWAHIVGSSDGALVKQYTLEIRPADARRHHYGTYPLLLTWGVPGTPRYAESRCVLVITPCVRLTAQPTLAVRPTGQLSLALENCGATGIEVSITLSHHGSSWSRGWEVELGAKDGPFEFSEQFDLPPGAKKGEFELTISAEGIPVVQTTVRPVRSLVTRITRKHLVTAAVALAAVAVTVIPALLSGGGSAALQDQKINFTTVPPVAPVTGSTYVVAATGGRSGNPVTFSIDPPSASVCSISGSTVTFRQAGSCVIDANQAGDAKYQAAPQAPQAVIVTGGGSNGGGDGGGGGGSGGGGGGGGGGGLLGQTIAFTSVPPASPLPGDTYVVTATGGASGNRVTVSIDPPSAPACSISGLTVTFRQAGSCVIDANEAGNQQYRAAPQVQQTVTVGSLITQMITFPNPGPGVAGQSAPLTATGGGSGNPVVFSVDAGSGAGVCSVSGTNGSTVNYLSAGTCVIDANQAGGGQYQVAPQASQTVTVAGLAQTITFQSAPQGPYYPKDTYTVTATGGGSGNTVTFSIDPPDSAVCSVSGSTVTSSPAGPVSGATVTFSEAGSCVIDASQLGDAKYQNAQQVSQTATVDSPVTSQPVS